MMDKSAGLSREGSSGRSVDVAGVECQELLTKVYLLLDKECDNEEELRKHLSDCPPCLEQYDIDEHIKHLLAQKCGGDQAPKELRLKLQALIQEKIDACLESN
jgi:mycothiol system anti-sigma-R factor